MSDLGHEFEAYGTTVFCEDLRREQHGLLTLVGVFTGNMELPEIPAILPKFAVMTTVVLPVSEDQEFIGHDLTFQMFVPGDTDIPSVNISNKISSSRPTLSVDRDPDIPHHVKMLQNAMFSPFEVKQEGYIKVRIILDEKVIKAGVLKVIRASASDSKE